MHISRFTIAGSIRIFCKWLFDEAFTTGQGKDQGGYLKMRTKSVSVDLKQTNQPHRPELEVIFFLMVSLLCTIVFNCMLFCLNPAFGSLGSNIWSTPMLCIIIFLILIVIVVYKLDILKTRKCIYIYY